MGLAFLITTDQLRLLSERKVLKSAEYAAMLDAAALIDTARKEAARIVRDAARQVEDSRQRGYDDGAARARADQAQRLVSEALASQQQLQALRSTMAQFVVKGVAQLVGEIDTVALISRALQRVDALIRHEPYLSVRVAPALEEPVRALFERWSAKGAASVNVAVQADASLAADACIVQSASGTLEIGVQAQLEAFRLAIEQGGAPPGHPVAR